MPNDTTSYLGLPLPHPDNLLEGDVLRLRDAFTGVDSHAADVDAELRVKANAADVIAVTNTKADATSTTKALQTLDVRISQVAIDVPKLNNTVTSTSTAQAATANAAKLAYDRGTAGVTAAATAQTAANAAKTAAATAQTSANAAKIAADVANSGVNILGTLFIGAPIYLSTTTLPANCMWADGSLALLADWPQFAAKYKAGGFAGMVLAANSTQAIKDANLGKFVLNANSTGLYMPRYGGQFMRGWTPGQKVDVGRQAGSWQANEFKTHLHAGGGNPNVVYCDSTSSSTVMHAGTSTTGSTGGIETRPTNNAQPIVIYMGVHA